MENLFDLAEYGLGFALDKRILPVEIIAILISAIWGYKLYEGNKDPYTDTIGLALHYLGILMMSFSAGGILALAVLHLLG